MKIFFILVSLVFSTSLYANLVEEVDKLTPEEAKMLVEKLNAKFFEPVVPQSFFTRATMAGSFGAFVSYPRSFNEEFMGADHENFKSFGYGQFSLQWYLSQKFMLGILVDAKMQESEEEISSNVYETVTLVGAGMHIACTYRFDISENWFFTPTLAIGPFVGSATRVTDDDNDGENKSHNYSVEGIGYSGMVVLPFLYDINKVFSIGPELSYQFARVDKLKRYNDEVSNPKNITFNGFGAGLKIAYNY